MSGSLKTRRLIDQLGNLFEENWSAENRPEFGSWLERIEPRHRGELLRVLLEVDFELRTKAGQQVTPND